MNWTDWIYILSVQVSAIAAILAWVAKLRWSQEYRDAKEAELQAKDEALRAKDAQIATLNAQIRSLQNLAPMKIREYFASVTTQLEEYNDQLQQELAEKERQLKAAHREAERSQLEGEKTVLELQINAVRSARHKIAHVLLRQATTAELGTALGMTDNEMQRLLEQLELL